MWIVVPTHSGLSWTDDSKDIIMQNHESLSSSLEFHIALAHPR